MALQDQLLTFDQLTQQQVAAIQGATTESLEFQIGSIVLAIVQANSGVTVNLESIAVYLLGFARASSSQGADLDSWMAQYGFTRLPAVSASGLVTFSRFTSTNQATIPVGSLVQTTIGNIQFSVYADSTNSNFNGQLNAYIIPAGTSSINVPVQAVVPGSAGNAAQGQINAIAQAIQYVDTVTNPNTFSNGLDAESDTAFGARWQLYFNGQQKGTRAAIESAIEAVQGNIDFSIVENVDYAGNSAPGFFYVVIDDGSGNPPDSLVTAVENAVAAVDGYTITFAVYKVVTVNATVSANVAIDPNYDSATVIATATTAVENYINGLQIGQALYYTKLPQVIYDSSPGVLNVSSLLLNGGTTDLTVTNQQSAYPDTITLTAA